MELSVLLPMYNVEDYIGNCLKSLVNQDISIEDYEIIIINDGSTDSSYSIAKSYANKYNNIKLFSQENIGLYATRNRLLKLAKGDYIYNLDPDDYIVHNCLGKILNLAKSNRLDIIGFNTKETSNLKMLDLSQPITQDSIDISSGKTFIENYPHFSQEVWWYFIKNSFVKENHMEFNKNQYNADILFTVETLLMGNRFGYIPVSIHRYVINPNSLMRSKNVEVTKKRIEFWQMLINDLSKILDDLRLNNNSQKIINNLSHRRDKFVVFNIVNMIRNPFSLDYIKGKIKAYKSIDAYPIKNFNEYRYSSIGYRALLKIINSETLIYTLISLKNIFSKNIK